MIQLEVVVGEFFWGERDVFLASLLGGNEKRQVGGRGHGV